MKLNCDIIQISLGTLFSTDKMMNIVQKLTAKGILIISAFDNDKAISYPAAYEEVIGVDVSDSCDKISEYNIIKDNVIDIQGADIYYRVLGYQGKYIIVKGSSFYCSCVCANIINSKLEYYTKKDVMNFLEKNAKKVYNIKRKTYDPMIVKNAILFPFNKEIHSLAAFEYLIKFDIKGYYDLRQKGLVGRRISEILPYTQNNSIILDYDNIDWNDESFDTVICGHLNQISKLCGRDFLDIISQMCQKHNKQLVCFDNITKYAHKYTGLRAVYPFIDKANVPVCRFGKLRTPAVPIVGVFGTSSCQGKMTIQLRLRSVLLNNGFRVKNIGSEPESALLGMEYTYTFGYESSDNLSPDEMIHVLNEAIYELEKDNCDILIVGSQSGTVPHQLRNLCMIPIKQYCFLLGTQPDSIILCVNPDDSIEYVDRTIQFFKSMVNATVICMIVYDVKMKFQDKNSIEKFRNNYEIPVLCLSTLDDNELKRIVLDYYSS